MKNIDDMERDDYWLLVAELRHKVRCSDHIALKKSLLHIDILSTYQPPVKEWICLRITSLFPVWCVILETFLWC